MSTAPTRRSLLRAGAVAVSVAALGGAGWWAWVTWGRGDPVDPYLYATATRGDIEDLVTATGSLQPLNYVDVGAQVSGQLRKIHVDVGSEVTEGELMAEIDAEQSQARVDASRAQLRAQGAQMEQFKTNLAKAERDLQRQRNLMAEEATTTEQVQNADTALKLARAQIDTLTAQMEQVKASMRVDESNLKFTRIYAPIAGTVVSITARQGQTLNTNQSAPIILRVADLSTMTVQTQVSEADVSRLRLGMPAYFTTLGSQARRWSGQLKRIEPTPTVTNNVVLYNALFDVPNPNRALMPQMTAQVFFVTAQARNVVLLPMSAITLASRRGSRDAAPIDGAAIAPPAADGDATTGRRRARTGTVKIVSADGSLAEREVQVGVSNRVHAEIVSGVAEGERVVAGLRQADTPRRASASPGGTAPGPIQGPPPIGPRAR